MAFGFSLIFLTEILAKRKIEKDLSLQELVYFGIFATK